MAARTVYELLQLLERYHQQRREMYQQLAGEGSDDRARILLRHLVELEQHAINIIHDEASRLTPEHAAYLPSGPTLTIQPTHAMDCRCEENPSFDDALQCALTSDEALDEVIDRIENGPAASSVHDLAARLREVERTKDREIAKYTRED